MAFLIQTSTTTDTQDQEISEMETVLAPEAVMRVATSEGVFFTHPVTGKPSVVVCRVDISEWDVNMQGVSITATSPFEAVHFADLSMKDPQFATNYVASLNPQYLN